MKPHQIMLLTPAGLGDPNLAIAASRAGALGILDLEFSADVACALAALDKLQRFTAAPFGIKIGPGAEGLVHHVATHAYPRLSRVILAGGDHLGLKNWLFLLRGRGREIFYEATNWDEVEQGTTLGVDAILIKGHEAAGRIGAETSFVLLQRYLKSSASEHGSSPPLRRGGRGGLFSPSGSKAASA